MGAEYQEENGKDLYNPYNLFLILILLILSKDVLKTIKQKYEKSKKVHKQKNKISAKRYRVLPMAERTDIKGKKSESEDNRIKEWAGR